MVSLANNNRRHFAGITQFKESGVYQMGGTLIYTFYIIFMSFLYV
jgi:hypothetical protein